MSDTNRRRDIRSEILNDLRPVRPLQEPWKRVSFTFVPWVATGVALMWFGIGLRADLDDVGMLWSWGVSGLFLASGVMLAVFALRESIPAASTPRLYAYGLIAAVLVAQIVVAASLHERHPYPVEEGANLRLAIICSSAICGLALLWAAALAFLVSRGLTIRRTSLAMLVGVATVAAAESLWRLHCPYTSTFHLLTAHFPPYLVVIGLGWIVARLNKRRP